MSGADLCRLCAEAKDKLIGIYDAEGQKLGIELKILKCLQIQVVINDSLPLAVCLDCCVQLDQCSDFFEKTNQAQSSLRNLITETKPSVQMGRVDLNYVEKTMGFPKEEQSQEEGMLECQLSENYIDDSVMYFNDEQNNVTDNDDNGDSSNGHAKYNSEEMLESVKHQIGCGVESKKKSNKQTKKRTKRKAQMQKLDVLELGITSDLEEKCMDLNTKVKIKIPDNYMTELKNSVALFNFNSLWELFVNGICQHSTTQCLTWCVPKTTRYTQLTQLRSCFNSTPTLCRSAFGYNTLSLCVSLKESVQSLI